MHWYIRIDIHYLWHEGKSLAVVFHHVFCLTFTAFFSIAIITVKHDNVESRLGWTDIYIICYITVTHYTSVTMCVICNTILEVSRCATLNVTFEAYLSGNFGTLRDFPVPGQVCSYPPMRDTHRICHQMTVRGMRPTESNQQYFYINPCAAGGLFGQYEMMQRTWKGLKHWQMGRNYPLYLFLLLLLYFVINYVFTYLVCLYLYLCFFSLVLNIDVCSVWFCISKCS